MSEDKNIADLKAEFTVATDRDGNVIPRCGGSVPVEILVAIKAGDPEALEKSLSSSVSDTDGLYEYEQGKWDNLARIAMNTRDIEIEKRTRIIELVFEHAQTPHWMFETQGDNKNPLLTIAIQKGWANIALILMENGADPAQMCNCGKHTPWIQTVIHDSIPGQDKANVLSKMVDRGIDISGRVTGYDDMIKYLRAKKSAHISALLPLASDEMLFNTRGDTYDKSSAQHILEKDYKADVKNAVRARAEEFQEETGFDPLEVTAPTINSLTVRQKIAKNYFKRVNFDFHACTMSVITTNDKHMDVKTKDFAEIGESKIIEDAAMALTKLGGKPGDAWTKYVTRTSKLKKAAKPPKPSLNP